MAWFEIHLSNEIKWKKKVIYFSIFLKIIFKEQQRNNTINF